MTLFCCYYSVEAGRQRITPSIQRDQRPKLKSKTHSEQKVPGTILQYDSPTAQRFSSGSSKRSCATCDMCHILQNIDFNLPVNEVSNTTYKQEGFRKFALHSSRGVHLTTLVVHLRSFYVLYTRLVKNVTTYDILQNIIL